jgi:hypothetical protein
MSQTDRQLFDLLPAVYRLRDAAVAGTIPSPAGEAPMGPLQAVLALLAEQLDALQDDLDQLYDDQFIETCAEWVVPYIADLIGDRPVHGVTAQTISQRAQVANTIHYRRRKGTVKMLEQLARDVTGWPAHAVEYFQVLATTQYLNHVRLGNLSYTGLRDEAVLELIDTPFDTMAHTADVRRIASRRGKYNIANIGLFLWRLEPFDITGGQPFALIGTEPGLFTFNPIGLDQPLFNPARSAQDFTHLAGESDVPGPLRRRPLFTELEAHRAALAASKTPEELYFGSSPVFQVFTQQLDGSFEPIDPANIFICTMTDWPRPTSAGQVVVDPVLGRLSFMFPPPPAVRVSYTYAFSAPMGGGPYDRQVRVGDWLPVSEPNVTFQCGVTQNKAVRDAAPNDPLVATLDEALAAWHAYSSSTTDPAPFGIIAIMDSATYRENLSIRVPKGTRLAIVAGDWPQREVEAEGLTLEKRLPGDLTPVGVRPVVAGTIEITGTPPAGQTSGGPAHEFILDGLLVTGSVTVMDGDLLRLRISDCTLVPAGGGLSVQAEAGEGVHNRFLVVHIENSIFGSLQLGLVVPSLEISGSIITNGMAGEPTQPTISANGTDTTINTTTVFGMTEVRSLNAQDSIFTGIVTVQRGQVGCVRYCYLPPGSRTPRPYRCQPDRAAGAALTEALNANPNVSNTTQNDIIQDTQTRVVPQFSSVHYGDPDFAQLSLACAVEIRTGAEDDSELGAFHNLFQPQRETNLRIRLDEYLRFGMEAGIFYVT